MIDDFGEAPTPAVKSSRSVMAKRPKFQYTLRWVDDA
ncbi:hypothetical protein EXN51_15320 [Agrobacterium fabrum]|uniref:Uncharacterized protein n=1 Tax=Agrobacterium fabrum (strain C58 / ATCC 33970) TaxID=176299 RepID=Q8U5V3_AGRFC|nr:hypothetical protein Atu8048 [Agrobacterium fabrum str. C58]KJX90340.1 hypothetical protein SY94_5228 [Agrobacterium tumefaciens]TRB28041.1 hypothetical protein EXN51_15320 [Agrobacterium fabrum]